MQHNSGVSLETAPKFCLGSDVGGGGGCSSRSARWRVASGEQTARIPVVLLCLRRARRRLRIGRANARRHRAPCGHRRRSERARALSSQERPVPPARAAAFSHRRHSSKRLSNRPPKLLSQRWLLRRNHLQSSRHRPWLPPAASRSPIRRYRRGNGRGRLRRAAGKPEAQRSLSCAYQQTSCASTCPDRAGRR